MQSSAQMVGRYLGAGTPILMGNGTTKEVQDIKVGDEIMCDDSVQRKVTKTYLSTQMLYELQAVDESRPPYLMTDEFILALRYNCGAYIKNNKAKGNSKYERYQVNYPESITDASTGLHVIKKRSKTFNKKDSGALEKAQTFCKTVKEGHFLYESTIADHRKFGSKLKHNLLAYRVGITKFPIMMLQEIEPYMVGLWLGDGSSANTHITTIDPEIIEYIYDFAQRKGMSVTRGRTEKSRITYALIGGGTAHTRRKNCFINVLRCYDMINNKHIPYHYQVATRKRRLELLAGLIDTDGYLGNDSYYEITQKSIPISDGIVFVARSLGFYISRTECTKGCWYKDEYRDGLYQRMNICSTAEADISEIPVRIKRKKIAKREEVPKINLMQYRFSINESGVNKCYGIKIDGASRYLLGDFTVVRDGK